MTTGWVMLAVVWELSWTYPENLDIDPPWGLGFFTVGLGSLSEHLKLTKQKLYQLSWLNHRSHIVYCTLWAQLHPDSSAEGLNHTFGRLNVNTYRRKSMREDGRFAVCSKPETIIIHPNLFTVLMLNWRNLFAKKRGCCCYVSSLLWFHILQKASGNRLTLTTE